LPNTKIKNVECVKWDKAKFVPIILSLLPMNNKFIDNVPIVPVLQLQDFLNQLPLQIESLNYFSKTFNTL